MVSHSVFSTKPDWSASTPNSGCEVDWAALSKFLDAKPVQQNTNSNRDVDWVSLTKAADENLAKPVENSGREVDWVSLSRQSGVVSSGENDDSHSSTVFTPARAPVLNFSSNQRENSAYRSLDVIFNPTQVGDVTYLLSDGCLVPVSTLLAKAIGSALLSTRDAFDARDRLWEARGSTINPSFLDVVKEAYLFKTDPVYANAYVKRRREKEDEAGDQLQLKKQNTTVDKVPESPTTRDRPAVPSNQAQPRIPTKTT
ncbi:hypothetical protein HDV05_004173 [Chytridiales sp. JEL 0842]|nr:hypothetical protein HDV05_004173 [Chytridiales sp. JEL 0842]